MEKMNQVIPHSLDQRLAQLFSRINYERQSRATPGSFKLQNMRDLSQRLDNPQLKYPVVHVAGTKGKGSVATMIGAILSSAGRRTGVYTSPHLETINQRMAIDGQFITDQQLLNVLEEIHPVIEEMDCEAGRSERRHLTFFEVTTAAMFYHFAKQTVDFAVVEVGLGGRLDSTNICQPQVAVITNISFDHTKQLGNTLDKIAAEKAGIIKPGIPVVSGAVTPAAADVIQEIAATNEAPLYVLERDFHIDISAANGSGLGVVFDFKGQIGGETLAFKNVQLNMLGAHQASNAAIAIVASQLLRQQGTEIREPALRTGLQQAAPMGRTEIVGRGPTVIIDMAHNVASIMALVESLKQLPNWNGPGQKRLVVATSRDKDSRGMLRLLVRHFDEIVFTRYQNNPRGKSPAELLRIATSLRDQMNLATRFAIAPDPISAWNTVKSNLKKEDLVCITGSAFLVAELRKTVLESGIER